MVGYVIITCLIMGVGVFSCLLENACCMLLFCSLIKIVSYLAVGIC